MQGAKPKYSLIADQLMREINDGTLPVGAAIPTESELMRAYGVSRHTVRTALGQLRARGVVSSRQGQGSRVVATAEQVAFTEKIQSVDELITFGQETRRTLLSRRIVEADSTLARMFGCAPGRRVTEARMVRTSLDKIPKKIAIVTLWIDALLDPVVEAFEEQQKSAAQIIRDRFGLVTGSVTQTIEADSLEPDCAELLDTAPGAPALIVTRSYCQAENDVPFLIARSVCKAGSFQVVSRFTAQR